MFIKALKAKIHRATVTKAKIDYPGSIAVDADLLETAGISPYEAVLMANVTNGERAETYVIPAPAGSGEVSVLGAAARLFNPDDIIIIINFAYYTAEEIGKLKPKVVVCDENNKIKKVL
ncbi:MAG: aspartate 1-decarboxylase [Planctomycetes bacterium]|nr:aspartate 1-decarboxylase [Planctomycetota bacterium]